MWKGGGKVYEWGIPGGEMIRVEAPVSMSGKDGLVRRQHLELRLQRVVQLLV